MREDLSSEYDSIPVYEQAIYKEKLMNDKLYHILLELHGSKRSLELFHENIDHKVVDAENWLFLIEGVSEHQKMELLGLKMPSSTQKVYSRFNSYNALRFTRENNIPVFDPIIAPSSIECVNDTIKSGMSEDIAYTNGLLTRLFFSNSDESMYEKGRDYGLNRDECKKYLDRIFDLPEKKELRK